MSSGRIIWFLLTVATTVLLSLVGAWAMDLRAVQVDHEKRIAALERQLAEMRAELNAKLDLLIRRTQ